MMRVLQMVLGFVLLMTGVAGAREGYLRTRAGTVLDGHIRFESNRVVVVNVPMSMRSEVALTNIVELVFLPSAEDEPFPELRKIDRAEGLPLPWASEDIGHAMAAGEAQMRRGSWRVQGSGTNALGTADACHFVFKSAGERSEIVARVVDVQRTEPWARAGLMFRESMAPGARNIFVSISSSRGGVTSWRERYAEEAQVSLDGGCHLGWWLKLKRDGNQFSAFRSRNAMQWNLVGRWVMPIAKDCYVGLAVTGNGRSSMLRAVFEDVEESVSLRNRWHTPQVELTSGSARRGHIEAMDDRFIYFTTSFGREPVARTGVVQVRFQPLTSRGAREFSAGRRGVLLTTGEFVDGECRSIEEGRLILSSVPMGLLRYDVNSEVVAMALGDRRAVSGSGGCEARMTDGSVWRGRELEILPLGLRLREPTAGWLWLPLSDLLEVRREQQ